MAVYIVNKIKTFMGHKMTRDQEDIYRLERYGGDSGICFIEPGTSIDLQQG